VRKHSISYQAFLHKLQNIAEVLAHPATSSHPVLSNSRISRSADSDPPVQHNGINPVDWLGTGRNLPDDIDGDGDVDYTDYVDFSDSWLKQCPNNWPIK